MDKGIWMPFTKKGGLQVVNVYVTYSLLEILIKILIYP